MRFPDDRWALILGGSSGFGLATAQKLAAHGMNLCIVHRDRRAVARRAQLEFDKLREHGVTVLSFNDDALSPAVRAEIVAELGRHAPQQGVRLLMHSIALGNLKLIAPERPLGRNGVGALAAALEIPAERLRGAVNALLAEGCAELCGLASPPRHAESAMLGAADFAGTIAAMGTNLVEWAQHVLGAGLFAADVRVLGLTSEGSHVAIKGYAAVGAAKAALESVARALAVELAPYGVRTNVIQAGVTDTPALRMIPGSERLKANALLRNPFGRLTTPRDVADAVYLLCRDEAAWINGVVLRVDGGEGISGTLA